MIKVTSKTPFREKTAMHGICRVNPSRSATARLRGLSLQLPHLSVFSCRKRDFRVRLKGLFAVTLVLSAAALAGCSSNKSGSDAEATTEAVTNDKSYAFRLTDKGAEISRKDGEIIQEIEFYSPWLKDAYEKDPNGDYFKTADFDFDGDDDAAVLVSAENNAETYQYFRYDKEKNTFEGWGELDIMYSLAAVDKNAKTLSFHSPNGEEGYYDTVYRWTDDERLMPVSAVMQYSDGKEAVRYNYEYDENGVSTCLKKERVLRDENGRLTDKTEELPIDE